MSTNNFKKFDAVSVLLEGTNLIEASAGTGKTYSIALMVLRLIAEKGVPLSEILMVTFTKAAVAELQERIRLFIREGYKVVHGQVVSDSSISLIISNAQNKYGEILVQQRMHDATLCIDDLAILTIHGFCQQTLNEFAIETEQVFGTEMLTETDTILDNAVNDFWRKQITSLDKDILKSLGYETLKGSIKRLVKEHLDGKKYVHFDENQTYYLSDLSVDGFTREEQKVALEVENGIEHYINFIEENIGEIRSICTNSKVRDKEAKSQFIENLENPKAFIELLFEYKDNVLSKALYSFLGIEINSLKDKFLKQEQYATLHFRKNLFCFALQEILKKVQQFFQKNTLLTYNDLILNLYTAISKPNNQALVAALQQKYKAVFVDEFQDTDREQYVIFKNAFDTNTILFLIGDPKQSIYAWRKADIDTYFSARNSVQHCYEMNINYRSNEGMIKAMNQFFQPEIGFDTFAFLKAQNSIEYYKVDSPTENKKWVLKHKANLPKPFTFLDAKNKEEIYQNVANEIKYLLSDTNFYLQNNTEQRGLKAADIGILVRSSRDGRNIKDALLNLGVTATLIQDGKIFDTQEATEILHVLEAIIAPQLSNIHRALLTRFVNFSINDILKMNDELIFSLFSDYKNIWLQSGVYPALMRFYKDFEVEANLLKSDSLSNEKSWSVLNQLATLLHQAQFNKNLQMEELIAWLRRHLKGEEAIGDEYFLPLESDEDAIKIVTIHKSKGLEYNIVFAPFLDTDFLANPALSKMNEAEKFFAIENYRDAEGVYVSKEVQLLTDEEKGLQEKQKEQENRRLIYVAITRAVAKCYVYKNVSNKVKNSGLSPFYNALKNMESLLEHIEFAAIPEYTQQFFDEVKEENNRYQLVAKNFRLQNDNWYKLSYTSISGTHDFHKKDRERIVEKGTYDYFIFHELPSGAETGNFVHYIFEKIDFANVTHWESRIAQSAKNYLPYSDTNDSVQLLAMIDHVVHATILIDKEKFSLANVSFQKRISELEFDFRIDDLNIPLLQKLSNDSRNINTRTFEYPVLTGILNGKVDLFFEQNGKYYILDWKSNYLGNSVESYEAASLNAAMNENNYHLQYLIYTLAVCKYLESKIEDFDYETHFGGVVYLFLRGVRKDANTGIFATKPKYEDIKKMQQIIS